MQEGNRRTERDREKEGERERGRARCHMPGTMLNALPLFHFILITNFCGWC